MPDPLLRELVIEGDFTWDNWHLQQQAQFLADIDFASRQGPAPLHEPAGSSSSPAAASVEAETAPAPPDPEVEPVVVVARPPAAAPDELPEIVISGAPGELEPTFVLGGVPQPAPGPRRRPTRRGKPPAPRRRTPRRPSRPVRYTPGLPLPAWLLPTLSRALLPLTLLAPRPVGDATLKPGQRPTLPPPPVDEVEPVVITAPIRRRDPEPNSPAGLPGRLPDPLLEPVIIAAPRPRPRPAPSVGPEFVPFDWSQPTTPRALPRPVPRSPLELPDPLMYQQPLPAPVARPQPRSPAPPRQEPGPLTLPPGRIDLGPEPQPIPKPELARDCPQPKKRKPREPRTECRKGTYIETSKGLKKTPREKVPCQ